MKNLLETLQPYFGYILLTLVVVAVTGLIFFLKSRKKKFRVGDHVEHYTDGDYLYGHVVEVRRYENGGWEYLVDFYTSAMGKQWAVEWRLKLSPKNAETS